MANTEFIYNAKKTIIQCNPNDLLEDIIKKFCLKVTKNMEDIYFLYGGQNIDKKKTFIEQASDEDKKRNKISILVFENNETTTEKLKKSPYILCPICGENILIKIEGYKITLYDCKNGHKKENILLNEFENTQIIDESKIKCNNCQTQNKSTTFNNKFYFCLDCKINLCPLCKSTQEKNHKGHKIIDYEQKYFVCNKHNELCDSYCTKCKEDICIICINEHKNCKIEPYSFLIPNIEEFNKIKNDLRKTIDELKKEINEIIRKLNSVIDGMEIYYKIYDDIMNNYDIRKKNYSILKNIKEINDSQKNFIENLNILMSNNDVKGILNIYNLMNETSTQNIKTNIKIMKKENLIINKEDYNSFYDFNIEKIETLASFREKYTNQKIMLMHNGRILSVNNGFYSIYDLESNTSSEIFQRGNIKDSIILTKQGDIIISEESNVNVVKCGEYYKDLWQNLLNLANGQYLEFYNTSSIFYYSFYFQKLIYIKRDKINLQKREINEIYDIDCDQIAIRASVNDTENQKLYFYDLNKNKEITSIKLNDDNIFEICVVSDQLIILDDNVLKLMNLKNHKIIDKIDFNTVYAGPFPMTLDHNKFLVFADIEIYQYEIKDYNKIVYKNKKEWDKPVRDKTEIEKIFGNKLIQTDGNFEIDLIGMK